MVPAVVLLLTRWSSAPGVHSGSSSPPTVVQPVVLVRGAGVQAETTTTGTDTAAVSTGAATGIGCCGYSGWNTDVGWRGGGYWWDERWRQCRRSDRSGSGRAGAQDQRRGHSHCAQEHRRSCTADQKLERWLRTVCARGAQRPALAGARLSETMSSS